MKKLVSPVSLITAPCHLLLLFDKKFGNNNNFFLKQKFHDKEE